MDTSGECGSWGAPSDATPLSRPLVMTPSQPTALSLSAGAATSLPRTPAEVSSQPSTPAGAFSQPSTPTDREELRRARYKSGARSRSSEWKEKYRKVLFVLAKTAAT